MIDDINQGQTIFYNIYTKQQKALVPDKKTTPAYSFSGGK